MPPLSPASTATYPFEDWELLNSSKGKIREAKCDCASHPRLQEVGAGGQEFKASFSYVMNLKLAWAS
jgi:hypothetical protein